MRPFEQIPVDEWRRVMDVNVLSMFLTCRAVVPHDARAGRRADREHLLGDAVPRRAVPPALRDEQGRDRRVHPGAGEGARRRRDPRQLRRARLHDERRACRSNPEVVEALRDVSVSARTLQARPGARATSSARSSFLCGPGARSSPGRRWSSTAASTSIEPLAHRHAGGARDRRPQPDRLRPRRRARSCRAACGRALVWELSDGGRRTRCCRREVDLDPAAEWLMRCDRVDFEPGGIAYRHTHPGPGHPLPALRARSRSTREGARTPTGRASRGSRRARPGAGRRRPRTSRRRSCGCCSLPRRVRRAADDPLRRPGRRRQAQDPAGDDLPRAAGAAVTRSGGQVLVDQLVLHGADLAFGVPGESYLAVLDALHDAPLRLIVTRHEGGAANMAEAYGKLTGRPGVCLVTRGPGATHASDRRAHRLPGLDADAAARSARWRAAPSGARASRSSTTAHVFGPVAKWATQVDDAARLPEIVARAFAVAHVRAARAGRARAAGGHAHRRASTCRRRRRPARPAPPRPARRAARGCGELLAGAERPLIVVGEGGWTAQAGADVAAFARGAARSRSRRRSAARTTSTTRRRSTPATPASAMDPALAQRIARGRRAARARRPARRDHRPRATRSCDSRARASGSCTCIPTRTSSARVYQPELGDRVRARALRRGRAGARAGRGAARRGWPRRRPRRLRAQPARAPRAARATSALGEVMAVAARAARGRTRSSPTARATSRSGRTASTSSALPDAARAAQRARWATASRRRSPRRPSHPDRTSSASPATATS